MKKTFNVLVGSFMFLLALPLSAQELRTFIPLTLSAPQAQPYIKLMTRLGELTGIKFNLIDNLPASRAKFELQSGALDCSVGQADLVYADIMADVRWVKEPLLTGRQVVATVAPFNFRTRADLSGKRVMAVRESAPVEILTADKTLTFVEAPDGTSALRMLQAKRADILIIHEAMYNNVVSATPEFKDKFFIAETPYLTVKNLIWFSKKNEALADRMDVALKNLKASGEYAKIMSGR